MGERSDIVKRLTGRAAWYRDAHPETVKTPELLDEAAAYITELERDRERFKWTLQEIARQKTAEELNALVDAGECGADFEGGYNQCVLAARRALSESKP